MTRGRQAAVAGQHERENDGPSGFPGSSQSADEPPDPGFGRFVSMTRFSIGLAIFGVFVSSFGLLAYCLVVLAKAIAHAFFETSYDVAGAQHLAVELIELADFFLLGMVLYVLAVGMFQLFINPDIPIPAWMRVDSLDALKAQIVNVVVVLLAVTFLAWATEWEGERNLIYLGAAIGIVIVALGLFTWVHDRGRHEPDSR